MSTFTITMTRTELSLADLVLSGADDANPVGVTNYQEPARIARIRYAPSSDLIEGDVALSGTYHQTDLGFDVVTDLAASEAASRTLLAEVRAAIGQFSFTTTVVVDGAPSEAWACDMGSMSPEGPRSFADLENHDPVWSVAIPVHPTPTIGV